MKVKTPDQKYVKCRAVFNSVLLHEKPVIFNHSVTTNAGKPF